MDWWIFQFFAVVLAGAAVIVAILVLVQRGRRKGQSDELGVPGNLPAGPGINISRVVVGLGPRRGCRRDAGRGCALPLAPLPPLVTTREPTGYR
jgi:hypothetical protein